MQSNDAFAFNLVFLLCSLIGGDLRSARVRQIPNAENSPPFELTIFQHSSAVKIMKSSGLRAL